MNRNPKLLAFVLFLVLILVTVGALCAVISPVYPTISTRWQDSGWDAFLVPTKVPTPTPKIVYVVATPTPTPTPARKQYPGLVRIDKPPETINGNPIPAWSNLRAAYRTFNEKKGQSSPYLLTVGAYCAPASRLYQMYEQGGCGIVIGATLDGVELKQSKYYNYFDRTSTDFSLPGDKRPTTMQTLKADIWVLPNLVYQATWRLDPKEYTPIGPLEFTQDVDQIRALAKQVQWEVKKGFIEKGDVNKVVILEALIPYIENVGGSQLSDGVSFQYFRLNPDFTFTIGEHMKRGAYLLRVSYWVSDVKQGGRQNYYYSPFPEEETWIDP